MSIMATKTGGAGRDLGPLAPGGVHQAVCADVIDLGLVKGAFEGKPYERHKVTVVWQLQRRDAQTQRRYLVAKRYTLSLNERATLRTDLESWRTKAFSPEEERGFDVERLVGVNCMLSVAQVTKPTGTYANVIAIMPLMTGMAKMAIENYQRTAAVSKSDEVDDDPFATDATSTPPVGAAATAPAVTDDDIPF